MIDPEQDGISHLNVYSNAKTPLGKFLSNFAYSPFQCEDGSFNSIEGYWYWLGCDVNLRKEELRNVSGYAAKKLGKELRADDWPNFEGFKEKILKAITLKLNAAPDYMLEALKLSREFPLLHYYVFGKGDKAKVHVETGSDWILNHIDQYRKSL